MDLFLSVHLQKKYLLITLLINLLILFKWTLLEKSLRSLLRSLVIKSLIDNIFVEGLGFKLHNWGHTNLDVCSWPMWCQFSRSMLELLFCWLTSLVWLHQFVLKGNHGHLLILEVIFWLHCIHFHVVPTKLTTPKSDRSQKLYLA